MDREAKESKDKAGAKTLPPGGSARASPRRTHAAQRLADALAQQAATNEILRVMAGVAGRCPAGARDDRGQRAASCAARPFARVLCRSTATCIRSAGYCAERRSGSRGCRSHRVPVPPSRARALERSAPF